MKLFFANNLSKSDGEIFFPFSGDQKKDVPKNLPGQISDNWKADYEILCMDKGKVFYKLPALNLLSKSLRSDLKENLGIAIKALKGRKIKMPGINLPSVKRIGQDLIEDILGLPIYMSFDEKSFCTKSDKFEFSKVFYSSVHIDEFTCLKRIQKTVQSVTESTNYARYLTDLPGNILGPSELYAEAEKLRSNSINIRKLPQKILKKMGGLCSVGKGSDRLPCFIEIELNPSDEKPVILIGKGVTFDSGGINIKTEPGMHEEKGDMAGGAVVLGIIQALSRIGYKKRIVAMIPAVENLPDGKSARPGDVIKLFDGTTVEITNTDAEGRLILGDALGYARQYDPELVIDVATLTSNVSQALSSRFTGLFCNDSQLAMSMLETSARTGDLLWQLPLHYEFVEEMKGRIADLINASVKAAGACTAAAFLSHFVSGPWIHLDIAGSAIASRQKSYVASGCPTGVGVRLVTNFLLQKNCKGK